MSSYNTKIQDDEDDGPLLNSPDQYMTAVQPNDQDNGLEPIAEQESITSGDIEPAKKLGVQFSKSLAPSSQQPALGKSSIQNQQETQKLGGQKWYQYNTKLIQEKVDVKLGSQAWYQPSAEFMLSGFQDFKLGTSMKFGTKELAKSGLGKSVTQYDAQTDGLDKNELEQAEERSREDLLQYRGLNARQYLNKIAFDIKLNSLYTIHSASNFNNFDRYSAIILKLGHYMRTVQNPGVKNKNQEEKIDENIDRQKEASKTASMLIKWNIIMQSVNKEKERAAREGTGGIKLIASDPTPTHVTEQCFGTLFYLINSYKPRWSVVRKYLQEKPDEFMEKFQNLKLETIPPQKLEWVLEFCHDPECTLQKCENELEVVRIFSEWLHMVSSIYEEKQKRTIALNPPYLLQIWSNAGQCVYERPMNNLIKRWNLFGNQFIFMEDNSSMVAVECFDNKYETIVRNFILQKQQVDNSTADFSEPILLDDQNQIFNQMAGIKDKQGMTDDQAAVDEIFGLDQEIKPKQKNSLNTALQTMVSREQNKKGKKSRKSVNESPKRTIGLFGDKLIAIINKPGEKSVINYYKIDLKSSQPFQYLSEDSAQILKYPKWWNLKWHMCADEGDGDMLLIAEDLGKDNQLIFFNIYEKPSNPNKLQLERQGLIKDVMNMLGENIPTPKVADLIVNLYGKKNSAKTDLDETSQQSGEEKIQVKGESIMTCLCLREDNVVSSYSDCNHIQTWQVNIPVKGEIVTATEINTDGSYYMIKALTRKEQVIDQHHPQQALTEDDESINISQFLMKCRISWRHNISENQFSLCKSTRKNTCALNSRISDFYRLYSGLLNIGTYYLISHRNNVSLYDLRQSESNYQYCETIAFPERIKGLCVLDVGHSDIKKSDRTFISGIVAITEDNNLNFFNLKSRKIYLSDTKIKVPGTNARIYDDQFCESGVYFINDENQMFVYAGGEEIQRIKIEKFHTISKNTNISCMPINKDPVTEHDVENFQTKWFHHVRSQTPVVTEPVNDDQSEAVQESEHQPPPPTNINQFTAMYVETDDECSVFTVEREPFGQSDLEASGFKISIHHAISYKKHLEDEQGLVNSMAISGEYFPDYVGWYIRLSLDGLTIYNEKGQLQSAFTNIKLAEAKYMSENLFLMLVKGSSNEVKAWLPDPDQDGKLVKHEEHQVVSFKTDALYCIDIGSLISKNTLISFKLMDATVLADPTANNVIDYCPESQRLGFLTNDNKLLIIPFPQSNKIYFQGMKQKSEYIMWRAKNGFFSALNKKGVLFTWSMIRGDLLYSHKKGKFDIDVDDYEPYQAYEEGSLYYSDYYQLRECTLQLLQRKVDNKDEMQEVSDSDKQEDVDSDEEFTTQLKQVKYQFKVLKMQLHQDRGEDYKMIGEERVTELFNFKLVLQEKRDNSNMSDDKGENRIFLSHDTKHLMIIQQGYCAEFYDRTEPDHKKKVKWRKRFRQDQFAELLQQQFSFNFLFSPNFKYYLTFKFNEKKFVINSTDFADQPFELEIPKDLFVTQEEEDTLTIDWIKQTCQRFHFVSEHYFRLVNKEGIDCLISFRDKNLRVENSVKQANFHKNVASDHHLFLNDSCVRGEDDILPRLRKRRTEVQKSLTNQMFTETQRKWKGQQQEQERPIISDLEDLQNQYFHCRKVLSNYYKVDCTQQPVKAENAFYVSETSFTIADWILIDYLTSGENVDYQSLPEDLFLRLFFNVLPSGDMFLHQLVKNDNAQSLGLMHRGFTLAAQQDFELPMQYNNKGVTPIEYVLDIKNTDYKIFQQPLIVTDKEDEANQIELRDQNYENLTAASKLFGYTKDYRFMFQGQMLSKAVVRAIAKELPNIGEFMTSRCIMSSHQPKGMHFNIRLNKGFRETFSKEPALLEYDDEDVKELYYGVSEIQLWEQESISKAKMFKTEGLKKKMRTFYLDIPFLHKQCTIGADFITALCESQDVKIFKYFPVQALVNYHWTRTKIYLLLVTFVPYCILLVCYTYWSFVLVERGQLAKAFLLQEIIFIGLTLSCVTYYLILEVRQLLRLGLEYFTDFWNYIELLPLFCTYGLVATRIYHAEFDHYISDQFYNIQAVASLLFWIKLLFFMRLFRGTGYLVFSVITVMKEMSTFLLLLFIVMISFAFSFMGLVGNCQIQNENCEDFMEEPFFTKLINAFMFMFNFLIGNLDSFSTNAVGQLIFIICAVILVIMMLNILIAIVSNSFQKVQDNEVLYTYSERCQMIQEWQIWLGSLYGALEHTPHETDLLFFAVEDEEVENDNWFSVTTVAQDRVLKQSSEDRVELIQHKVLNLTERLDETKKQLSERFDEKSTQLERKIDKVMSVVKKINPYAPPETEYNIYPNI